jgi:RNA polymerase sigma-70 factor, ECF subfamily
VDHRSRRRTPENARSHRLARAPRLLTGEYARGIGPRSDDSALIEAARGGDKTALDDLLHRHYDRIWKVCRRLAGNDADAADATQEALIAIVAGLPSFDGRATFGTWAYRVATNACLDELRRRGRRPDPGLPEHEETPRGGAPPQADQVVDRLAIDAALAELPPEFRAPIVLRDVLGLDYAEIAATLELRPGTVRSRIARGRAQLARSLGGNRHAHRERTRERP